MRGKARNAEAFRPPLEGLNIQTDTSRPAHEGLIQTESLDIARRMACGNRGSTAGELLEK